MQRARPLLPFSWRLEKASNRAKKLLVKRQNIFQKIPTNIVKKLKLLPKDKLKWPWLIGGPGRIISFSLEIAIFLINFKSIFILFSYQFLINENINFQDGQRMERASYYGHRGQTGKWRGSSNRKWSSGGPTRGRRGRTREAQESPREAHCVAKTQVI